ncbi:MAG: acetate--CoA ligase family protein [Proteobacteria bacterium]|nr:acetate--CoA ligase family protein [Pseudomonadota bacterium]
MAAMSMKAGAGGAGAIGADRLAPLLAPRSIAFVGASLRPNTPGNDMMRMIRAGGYEGTVFGVDPNAREVEGYPCVPALADLLAAPDLAVLSVRNDRLEAALREAVAAGARAAVIFGSALLDDDTDPPLARRLAAIAAESEMPICGPNCMGFYNDLDRIWVCGFPSPRTPVPGSIAFIAHSGSVFGALAHNDPRLRFAFAVSPGGEATATVADYIAYAVSRPEVRVIGLFIETARDPVGFAAALALAASRGVPVVALKLGRTAKAAAAALTHTGARAGSDLAYDALFDRHGVIRVETLDELAVTLLLLSAGKVPAAGGLVAIGDSGGERELLIDLADRAGVPLATLSDATASAIAARLDPGLEAANPLDAWGTGAGFVEHFTACFADLVADPAAGIGVFSADLRDGYYLHRGFADAALSVARGTAKPVAVMTNYTQVRHDALSAELTDAGVPVLDGTMNGLVAVRGALAYRDFLDRPADPLPSRPAQADSALPRLMATSTRDGALDEAASLALLDAWGIPTIPRGAADTADAVRAAGVRLGYPLVCKTAEPGMLHKSDVGGVKLNLRDEAALLAAYADLSARLGPRVLVARMAAPGVELALGMVRDPQFGPVVTLGAGGTLVELLTDRRAALAPFGPATARRLLDGLALRRLLDGYRGAPAADIGRLVEAIARFSMLAADAAAVVSEIDVNPLIAGDGIMALDALVIVARETA